MIDTLSSIALSPLLQIQAAPFQAAAAGYSVLEAGANHFRDQNPTLFNLYNKVHALFGAIQAGILVAEFVWVVECSQNALAILNQSMAAVFIVGVSVTWGSAAFVIVYIADKILTKQPPHAAIDAEVAALNQNEVTLVHTGQEVMQRYVCAARMISSVVLGLLSLQPLLIVGCNVASLGYSLWKVSQVRWLQMDRDIPIQAALVDGVASRYLLPLIPDRREEREECPMCLDETDPKFYFCPDKSYHIKCLVPLYTQHPVPLLEGWQFRRRVGSDRDGRPFVMYPSSIPSRNLPSCPDCRREPVIGHQLYLTVRDTQIEHSKSSYVTLR